MANRGKSGQNHAVWKAWKSPGISYNQNRLSALCAWKVRQHSPHRQQATHRRFNPADDDVRRSVDEAEGNAGPYSEILMLAAV